MDQLFQNNKSEYETTKEEIMTMLGNDMIEVELNNKQLDMVMKLAFEKYRQRSENQVEEQFMFIKTDEHTNDYQLPNEVIEVRKLYRRNFGIVTGENQTGQLDPFDIAFTNVYMLQDGTLGGLASFDFYAQNLETAGRLFGQDFNFAYNSSTKRLKIMRNVRAEEEILVWIYNYIPDEQLLKDTYARPWIRSYALCEAKMILGSQYEKFSSYAGPQGGITLNGSQLKAEAMQEKLELEDQLKKYADGSMPLGFIFD